MSSSGCLLSSLLTDGILTADLTLRILGSRELIKEIADPWQRIFVLNCDFVQFSVIKTQSLAIILLFANNTVAPKVKYSVLLNFYLNTPVVVPLISPILLVPSGTVLWRWGLFLKQYQ